jgi:hypothetical protein
MTDGALSCFGFSAICVDFGVVDRKTSFLELWVGEDNARFARRAHQLGPRLVVLPVDADIIVYLLVFGDHLQPCQTLTQSLAEALVTP